jgi:hypothetical protein
MKPYKLFFILFMFLAVVPVSGQGIFHYYTGLFLPKHDAPPRKDRFFIDVHYATWQNVPDGVKLKPWSHTIHISRLLDIPFGKSNFAFAFGPGITANNFHSNCRYDEIIDPENGAVYSRLVPYTNQYKYWRNKLAVTTADFSAEFRFRTKHKRRFRLYAGGRAGFIIDAHTTTNGEDGKFKTFNIRNLNRIQYGITARLGWHRLTFSAQYSFTGIFKKGQGQDMNPFTAGLTIYIF